MRVFFPLSAKATDLKSLLITCALYIIASMLVGFVLNFLTWIPVLGFIIRLISQLFDYYCLAGIVVAVLIYFKV